MNRKHTMTVIVPVLLFAVLAVLLLHVLYSGAEITGRLTAREQEGRTLRTAVQYVNMRLDQAQNVSVGAFCGIAALEFTETHEGTAYLTRVYCYDGYLRELFCEADVELEPDAGEKLLPLDAFVPSDEDGLLTAELTADGETVVIQYNLRGRRKGAAG
ncbi:MAG: DUF4860 domain-containing protein [Clostridia bacterium]|nr:DUF4860 domain-containing protein [Clostridia bacterium]MBQ8370310.1 DUF4860 domain-containing protein [Clostridia bacterium]